jgi:monoamine oxidase
MFSVRDAAVADTGHVMIWLNGTGASALDPGLVRLERARANAVGQLVTSAGAGAGTDDDPRAVLGRTLKALRPASEGRGRIVRVQRWTASNALAGGAYMHWAPGQVARWAGRMGQGAGRLVFAGEHLGLVHTGMEAAFESAEAAAQAVMALTTA